MVRVQEGVGVETLCVQCNVCDAEVEQEDEDEDRDCDEGMRACGREEDFEDGVEGVEAVLGDLCSRAVSQ